MFSLSNPVFCDIISLKQFCFFESGLDKVPRVLKCLECMNAQVPKCLKCPSAWVPYVPKFPSAQVPQVLECLSTLSA